MPPGKRLPTTRDIQFVAGSLALDFVNTVGNRLGERDDYLARPVDFERWTRRARIRPKLGQSHITTRQLLRIRRLREQLYGLFRPTSGPASVVNPAALQALNREIKRLARDWHLDHTRDEVSWVWDTTRSGPDHILARIVADAAHLLTSGSYRKIRQCQGDECGWLFLDRSRQGNRRWCSMTDCGNRAKVRRFYHRRTGA